MKKEEKPFLAAATSSSNAAEIKVTPVACRAATFFTLKKTPAAATACPSLAAKTAAAQQRQPFAASPFTGRAPEEPRSSSAFPAWKESKDVFFEGVKVSYLSVSSNGTSSSVVCKKQLTACSRAEKHEALQRARSAAASGRGVTRVADDLGKKRERQLQEGKQKTTAWQRLKRSNSRSASTGTRKRRTKRRKRRKLTAAERAAKRACIMREVRISPQLLEVLLHTSAAADVLQQQSQQPLHLREDVSQEPQQHWRLDLMKKKQQAEKGEEKQEQEVPQKETGGDLQHQDSVVEALRQKASRGESDVRMSRPAVTRMIWQYTREQQLAMESDGCTVHADDRLQLLFGGRTRVNLFKELQSLLVPHLLFYEENEESAAGLEEEQMENEEEDGDVDDDDDNDKKEEGACEDEENADEESSSNSGAGTGNSKEKEKVSLIGLPVTLNSSSSRHRPTSGIANKGSQNNCCSSPSSSSADSSSNRLSSLVKMRERTGCEQRKKARGRGAGESRAAAPGKEKDGDLFLAGAGAAFSAAHSSDNAVSPRDGHACKPVKENKAENNVRSPLSHDFPRDGGVPKKEERRRNAVRMERVQGMRRLKRPLESSSSSSSEASSRSEDSSSTSDDSSSSGSDDSTCSSGSSDEDSCSKSGRSKEKGGSSETKRATSVPQPCGERLKKRLKKEGSDRSGGEGKSSESSRSCSRNSNSSRGVADVTDERSGHSKGGRTPASRCFSNETRVASSATALPRTVRGCTRQTENSGFRGASSDREMRSNTSVRERLVLSGDCRHVDENSSSHECSQHNATTPDGSSRKQGEASRGRSSRSFFGSCSSTRSDRSSTDFNDAKERGEGASREGKECEQRVKMEEDARGRDANDGGESIDRRYAAARTGDRVLPSGQSAGGIVTAAAAEGVRVNGGGEASSRSSAADDGSSVGVISGSSNSCITTTSERGRRPDGRSGERRQVFFTMLTSMRERDWPEAAAEGSAAAAGEWEAAVEAETATRRIKKAGKTSAAGRDLLGGRGRFNEDDLKCEQQTHTSALEEKVEAREGGGRVRVKRRGEEEGAPGADARTANEGDAYTAISGSGSSNSSQVSTDEERPTNSYSAPAAAGGEALREDTEVVRTARRLLLRLRDFLSACRDEGDFSQPTQQHACALFVEVRLPRPSAPKFAASSSCLQSAATAASVASLSCAATAKFLPLPPMAAHCACRRKSNSVEAPFCSGAYKRPVIIVKSHQRWIWLRSSCKNDSFASAAAPPCVAFASSVGIASRAGRKMQLQLLNMSPCSVVAAFEARPSRGLAAAVLQGKLRFFISILPCSKTNASDTREGSSSSRTEDTGGSEGCSGSCERCGVGERGNSNESTSEKSYIDSSTNASGSSGQGSRNRGHDGSSRLKRCSCGAEKRNHSSGDSNVFTSSCSSSSGSSNVSKRDCGCSASSRNNGGGSSASERSKKTAGARTCVRRKGREGDCGGCVGAQETFDVIANSPDEGDVGEPAVRETHRAVSVSDAAVENEEQRQQHAVPTLSESRIDAPRAVVASSEAGSSRFNCNAESAGARGRTSCEGEDRRSCRNSESFVWSGDCSFEDNSSVYYSSSMPANKLRRSRSSSDDSGSGRPVSSSCSASRESSSCSASRESNSCSSASGNGSSGSIPSERASAFAKPSDLCSSRLQVLLHPVTVSLDRGLADEGGFKLRGRCEIKNLDAVADYKVWLHALLVGTGLEAEAEAAQSMPSPPQDPESKEAPHTAAAAAAASAAAATSAAAAPSAAAARPAAARPSAAAVPVVQAGQSQPEPIRARSLGRRVVELKRAAGRPAALASRHFEAGEVTAAAKRLSFVKEEACEPVLVAVGPATTSSAAESCACAMSKAKAAAVAEGRGTGDAASKAEEGVSAGEVVDAPRRNSSTKIATDSTCAATTEIPALSAPVGSAAAVGEGRPAAFLTERAERPLLRDSGPATGESAVKGSSHQRTCSTFSHDTQKKHLQQQKCGAPNGQELKKPAAGVAPGKYFFHEASTARVAAWTQRKDCRQQQVSREGATLLGSDSVALKEHNALFVDVADAFLMQRAQPNLWNATQAAAFLQSLQVPHLAAAAEACQLRGEEVLQLTDDDLKILGVHMPVLRRRVLAAIAQLKNQQPVLPYIQEQTQILQRSEY